MEKVTSFIDNIDFNLSRQVKTLCTLLATQGAHLSSVLILPVQMSKGKGNSDFFWTHSEKDTFYWIDTVYVVSEISYPTPRKVIGNSLG